jgi:hypothetical protein
MAADIGGVFARGVEIGETADADRHLHLDIGLPDKRQVPVWRVGVQHGGDLRAQPRPLHLRSRHDRVETPLAE